MKMAQIIAERDAMIEGWRTMEEQRDFNKRLKKSTFTRCGGRCWYCGIVLTVATAIQPTDYTTLYAMDHPE